MRQAKILSAAVVCAAGAMMSAAVPADAALLVTFKGEPSVSNYPEFFLEGAGNGTLKTTGFLHPFLFGEGSTGDNGVDAPGGLRVETPLSIAAPGLGDGIINTPSGTTIFPDVTLQLTNFVGDGNNIVTTTQSGITTYQKVFSTPNVIGFKFLSGGSEPSVTLLEGTIGSAILTAIKETPSGALNSATITYTGGLIYNAMLAAGGQATGGSMGIGLTGIPIPGNGSPLSDSFEIGAGTTVFLRSIYLDAAGNFTYVQIPEPAAMSLIGMGAAAVLGMRRRVK